MSYNGVEAPDNGSQRTSDLPFYPAFLSIAHPLTDEDSWFWGVEVVYRRLCSSSQGRTKEAFTSCIWWLWVEFFDVLSCCTQ